MYTPFRSAGQDESDHLEAVSIACYTFHRPLHRSADQRRAPFTAEPARPGCDTPRTGRSSASLAMAIAAVIAFLAVDLVLIVVMSAGLH